MTISTVLGGAIMVVYTCLLLVTNRRYLPRADHAARLPARDPRVRVPACSAIDDGDRRRRPDREPAVTRAFAARLLVALALWAALVGLAYVVGLA